MCAFYYKFLTKKLMLNKSFGVIYFHFNFFSKKIVKIGVNFLDLDQNLSQRAPKHTTHVISLITLKLLKLKTLHGEGLINFRILFLKTAKHFEF